MNINIKIIKSTKNNKKIYINFEENTNATAKGNEIKKVQVQQQQKCQTKIKRKMPEQRLLNQNISLVKQNVIHNHFHNILRLFDVLPNFPFTTSETMGDFYL